MANVKVVIEEIVKGSGATKKVSNDIKDLNNKAKDASKATNVLKGSYTEFLSALGLVQQGLQYAKQGYEVTIGASQKYAEQVRTLSMISGQGAEDTSRFIQVLDDYKISAEDAEMATRKLKEKGLVPTVETLAKLAEGYQKIKDPAEKMKFVQDNLGKSGTKWLEVLNKSPEVLRKQAAGINENLILTQKQLDNARKLEIAQDNLNDTAGGLANTIGTKLTPAWTTVLKAATWYSGILDKMINDHMSLKDAMYASNKEIEDNEAAMLKAGDAAGELGDDLGSLADTEQTIKDATSRLTSEFTGLLSSMKTIQGENDNYAKTVDDLAKKEQELREEKGRLAYEMTQVNGNQKEYLSLVKQSIDIDNKMKELDAEKTKATEDLAKASKQRIVDLTQTRLAADGIIDSGEFEYLQDLYVQQGLVTRASADQAIAESKKADAYVQSFQKTHPLMEKDLAIMQQMMAMSGKVVQFGVNYSSNMPGSASMNPYTSPKTNTQYKSQTTDQYAAQIKDRLQGRDSGGPGVAGTPYAIGNISEVYVPKQGGTFIPLGKARGESIGNTYNIVINNPKRETTENSLMNTLKRISYTGAAA